jgi:hypothetical protein
LSIIALCISDSVVVDISNTVLPIMLLPSLMHRFWVSLILHAKIYVLFAILLCAALLMWDYQIVSPSTSRSKPDLVGLTISLMHHDSRQRKMGGYWLYIQQYSWERRGFNTTMWSQTTRSSPG